MNAAVTNVSSDSIHHQRPQRVEDGLSSTKPQSPIQPSNLPSSYPHPHPMLPSHSDGLHVRSDASSQTYPLWRQSGLPTLRSYLLRFSSIALSFNLLLLFHAHQAKERFDRFEIRWTKERNVSRTRRIGHHHQQRLRFDWNLQKYERGHDGNGLCRWNAFVYGLY